MTQKTKETGDDLAIEAHRLVSYIDSRIETLDAEYERSRGNRQMESIISGQMLELSGIMKAIELGFFSANS
jgi:hypothetical protein